MLNKLLHVTDSHFFLIEAVPIYKTHYVCDKGGSRLLGPTTTQHAATNKVKDNEYYK